MKLWDILKKKHQETDPPESIFKGDLAVKPSPVSNSRKAPETVPDSILFLGTPPVRSDRWVCAECGCWNSFRQNYCEVCGAERQEV